jgi:hypothetical protein
VGLSERSLGVDFGRVTWSFGTSRERVVLKA